ncbi:NAD(P)-dependent oxidoreductase [Paenibacillus sp. MER TA 81-3]|uniref:NAD-dependent epimerase/dehydratase family protein n=1 Tax=Paenibacillus sp. MER TA 81-3 TaxID=2939573 RepID=UPI00203A8D3F|nr:NAD(P)-dependent oxidoreductase [Paenibacillus sp. MER TA 81-3]MCM3339052.1 NAD(P)-dependent oxidoreductase [Paenibacillus sp. MER TA 81-3]
MNGGGTLLVTGASGFTGRHACRHFLNSGMRVVALTRRADADVSAMGAEVVMCDLQDRERVSEVVKQVHPDYTLHLAGMNSVQDSWSDPLHMLDVNVMSTLHLLNALRLTPNSRILIVTSKLKASYAPVFSPSHPYSLSKTLQELAALGWAHLFAQDVLLAEPSNLIGPGSSSGICGLLGRYIVQTEKGEGPPRFNISNRHEQRDFLDVRDAAAAYELILKHGKQGHIYPVESGRYRSLGSVANTFARCSLVPVEFQYGDETEPYSSVKPNDISFPERWGWAPLRAFEQSVADILHYYRKEGELH